MGKSRPTDEFGGGGVSKEARENLPGIGMRTSDGAQEREAWTDRDMGVGSGHDDREERAKHDSEQEGRVHRRKQK